MSGAMRRIGEYLGLLEDTGRYDDEYAQMDDPRYDDTYEGRYPDETSPVAAERPTRREAREARQAATDTLGGDNRNTLLVTRSIDPRVAKMRPAAKSTSRLASLSSISDKFMITGVPSR